MDLQRIFVEKKKREIQWFRLQKERVKRVSDRRIGIFQYLICQWFGWKINGSHNCENGCLSELYTSWGSWSYSSSWKYQFFFFIVSIWCCSGPLDLFSQFVFVMLVSILRLEWMGMMMYNNLQQLFRLPVVIILIIKELCHQISG